MTLVSRIKNENGQGIVEYALIFAMIALGAVVGLSLMGFDIGQFFANLRNTIAPAAAPPAA